MAQLSINISKIVVSLNANISIANMKHSPSYMK